MTLSLCALALMAGSCQPTRSSPPLRVLFVGNSLVYYNDLPARFATLHAVAHPGQSADVDMLVVGGGRLRQRLDDGVLASILSAQRFDVVVLQDVGGWPLCPPHHAECEDAPRALRDASMLVRAHRARPVWYATWQTVPAAQAALSAAVHEVASAQGIDTADVGAALQALDVTTTGAALRADGHPTQIGTWLAAASVLATLDHASLPASAPPRSCGFAWEGSGIHADRLASQYPRPPADCQTLGATQWAAIRAAVLEAPPRAGG
ncbi:hypothetical protein [Cognatiluteimonas weifangensis]|uniref:SGNH/GDSL hydrolase family protein n=1 Tax=Cognatiluteimonas weifangensis TaxID=2303539 RepID=A0A372DPN3_9GAMM|nr:hypothetical protein [Luteimonas weifangensis]RFP61538.1 hypothetical protein D0Y53_04285 [Luteimonas weifangensis]